MSATGTTDTIYSNFRHLKAVVFDWAGTTVDFGCQGPVQAFVESFAAFGVAVTAAEAREPMGMGKREHVAALCAMLRIAELWREVHGTTPVETDIDRIYAVVEEKMLSVITRFSIPTPGTLEAVAQMRRQGLRIGSCTGYPRSVAEQLAKEAKRHGYEPDVLVCATDVPQGRPAPDMCRAVLAAFGVDAPEKAVKIGDTVNDVLEGVAAGMWVIGITLSGSLAGLSARELNELSGKEKERLEIHCSGQLAAAGAHFTAPGVFACLPLLQRIDEFAAQGHTPATFVR